MANGIDPLTGLPSDLFDSVVNQIPLGTGIFPWDDLEATSRPVRPPLYGDDILPTSALLAGQHETTLNAQTVYTDGHHRILVAGDFGGSSFPQEPNVFEQEDTNVHGGITELVWPGTDAPTDTSILLDWQVLIVTYTATTDTGAERAIYVSLGNRFAGSGFRALGFGGFTTTGGDVNVGSQVVNIQKSYPYGMKLDKFVPAITPGQKLSMYIKTDLDPFDYYFTVTWIQ